MRDSSATLDAEPEQNPLSQESEGIIPQDAQILTSTQPITPTSIFVEKTPYEQARDELIRSLELWNAGHAEAASDTALQAYDDLLELHRVPGVKRSKIRAQIRQAANVYVDAGIAYIKNFVQQSGNARDALEEGRARMEDLRDVARNYIELDKRLNTAINALGSSHSTSK